LATNQIVKLGLEARANELRSSIDPEYSVRDIARILTEESRQKITPNSVQRYFAAFKKTMGNLPAVGGTTGKRQDPTAVRELQRTTIRTVAVQERLDTLQQLRDINQDTLDILKKAKDAEKGGEYLALAAIQRIEKQLELQAKLLGDLPTQPTVNITLIEGLFNEFRKIVLEVTCPVCRARIAERMHQVLGQ